MPFNPREITPTASLNRVRIMDLPGVPSRYALQDDERGKTAYELLGAQAVYNLIRERAHLLQLPLPLPDHPTNEVMAAFQQCFNSQEPAIQNTAKAIRAIFHRRIAILLAVLRWGDPANREARPEWDESYWSYWRSTQRIVIGGGLLRGGLGRTAETMIPNIKRDHYEAYLPLVGAACCASPEIERMAVLDFGGTSVKTGIAHYDHGALKKIREKASYPTPLGEPYSPVPQTEAEKIRVFDSMAGRVAESIMASPFADTISHAVVSVAAYIAPNGHPYPNSIGGYAGLQTLFPNLQQALSDAVGQKVGRPIALRLIHDGTAAATAHPGSPVIVFGTAIGVGTMPAIPNPCSPPTDVLDA